MMRLVSLHIDDLRIIEHAELACDSPLIYVYGANGAGKTTVLEAMHLLASGQSFRLTQLRHLIRRDQPLLRVSGDMRDAQGSLHRLGIEKHRSGVTRVRIDGQDVKRVSDLASYLPLRAVAPDSHALVSGSPALRRKFVDWGVFPHKPQPPTFAGKHPRLQGNE